MMVNFDTNLFGNISFNILHIQGAKYKLIIYYKFTE